MIFLMFCMKINVCLLLQLGMWIFQVWLNYVLIHVKLALTIKAIAKNVNQETFIKGNVWVDALINGQQLVEYALNVLGFAFNAKVLLIDVLLAKLLYLLPYFLLIFNVFNLVRTVHTHPFQIWFVHLVIPHVKIV